MLPSPFQYKVGTRKHGFRSSMAGLRLHFPMLHPEHYCSQRRVRGQSYWLGFLCKTLSFSVSSRFIPALSLTPETSIYFCCVAGTDHRDADPRDGALQSGQQKAYRTVLVFCNLFVIYWEAVTDKSIQFRTCRSHMDTIGWLRREKFGRDMKFFETPPKSDENIKCLPAPSADMYNRMQSYTQS